MELGEVLRRRRMVRRYRADPVADDALHRILDAACRAPSAGFAQGQSFVVVLDAAARRRVAEACGEAEHVAAGRPPWLSVAPVHIVVCTSREAYERRYAEDDKARSRPPETWDVPWWWVDAGAALMALLLTAVDEGLGAGVLAVDRAGLAPLLDLRDDELPVALVTVGHPAQDDAPVGSSVRRPRRAREEQVRWR